MQSCMTVLRARTNNARAHRCTHAPVSTMPHGPIPILPMAQFQCMLAHFGLAQIGCSHGKGGTRGGAYSNLLGLRHPHFY